MFDDNGLLTPADRTPGVLRRLALTCGACPSQWEGTLTDGRDVFIHFRHGTLQVGYGHTSGQALRDTEVVWSDSSDDGVMSEDRMLQLTGLTMTPDTDFTDRTGL